MLTSQAFKPQTSCLLFTCLVDTFCSSGTRVAVELIDSESDSGETINALVMSALHPIETLYPRLPKVRERERFMSYYPLH